MHQIFVFHVFYCNLKEKRHIRRNVNSKKEMYICEISTIIVLICQKLGSVGPVQQKLSCLCLMGKIKVFQPYLFIY